MSNCIVRVTWLVDASKLTDDFSLSPPHASLQELVQSLKQNNSFQDVKTLTTVETSVMLSMDAVSGSNEFKNTSMKVLRSENSSGTAKIRSQGFVHGIPGDKYELDIALELESSVVVPVKTKIILPSNHPVAFSISDIGQFQSAVVVEIMDGR